MMGFLKCILYAAAIGVGSFILGRLLPHKLFSPDHPPFRCLSFEDGGKIYNRIFKVKKWQNRLPDMSRIFPFLMQEKKVKGSFQRDLPAMISETCIAEWIHGLLCILALPCIFIWPGPGGLCFTILYILGNLPFMIIQRYNRPRLTAIQRRLQPEAQ